MPPNSRLARRSLLAAAVLAVAGLATGMASDLPADDPALLSSELKPLAPKALLLDLARTSAGIFAVGERGILLRSTDEGATWQQLPLPTRLLMTSIAAADGDLWVGGHGGQIFRSSDNGETWVRQRIDVWTPDSNDPMAGAPVLDLLFLDGQNGFALGAFSLLLRTRDGGVSWEPVELPEAAPAPEAVAATDGDWTFSAEELELADEADPHLNAMVALPDGTLILAGERGAMFRSRDGGEQWERLDFPYDGSMFGLLAWEDGHVLAYGLRGNAFESFDGGDSWSRLETGGEITLQGGVALPGGGALLVGNEGLLLFRPDAASPLERGTFQTEAGETPVLSGAMALEGRFLLIGEKGVGQHAF